MNNEGNIMYIKLYIFIILHTERNMFHMNLFLEQSISYETIFKRKLNF